MMTHTQYKKLRERKGTQSAVAKLLGVSVVTLSNRENGHWKVSAEAAAALESLPDKNGAAKEAKKSGNKPQRG